MINQLPRRSGGILIAATARTVRLRNGLLRRCIIRVRSIAQPLTSTLARPLLTLAARLRRGGLSLAASIARTDVRSLPLAAIAGLAHRGSLPLTTSIAQPRCGLLTLTLSRAGTEGAALALSHAATIAKARSGLLARAASITRTQSAALALSHAASIAKPRSGLLALTLSRAGTEGAALTRPIINAGSIAEALSIAVRSPRRKSAYARAIDAGHEPVILHHQSVAGAAGHLGPRSALRRRALGGKDAGCKKSHQGSHGNGQLHHRCTPSEWMC